MLVPRMVFVRDVSEFIERDHWWGRFLLPGVGGARVAWAVYAGATPLRVEALVPEDSVTVIQGDPGASVGAAWENAYAGAESATPALLTGTLIGALPDSWFRSNGNVDLGPQFREIAPNESLLVVRQVAASGVAINAHVSRVR